MFIHLSLFPRCLCTMFDEPLWFQMFIHLSLLSQCLCTMFDEPLWFQMSIHLSLLPRCLCTMFDESLWFQMFIHLSLLSQCLCTMFDEPLWPQIVHSSIFISAVLVYHVWWTFVIPDSSFIYLYCRSACVPCLMNLCDSRCSFIYLLLSQCLCTMFDEPLWFQMFIHISLLSQCLCTMFDEPLWFQIVHSFIFISAVLVYHVWWIFVIPDSSFIYLYCRSSCVPCLMNLCDSR